MANARLAGIKNFLNFNLENGWHTDTYRSSVTQSVNITDPTLPIPPMANLANEIQKLLKCSIFDKTFDRQTGFPKFYICH